MSNVSKRESVSRLRAAQRAWLDRVVKDDPQHRTLSQIARDAGVSTTTLTRFANDDEARTLSALTVTQVSRATGIAAPSDVRGAPDPDGLSEEAVPFILGERTDATAAAVRLLIGERQGADPWILRTRSLEDAGYYPGDVVILDLNAAPRPRDAVCAQVYDWQRGAAETVWRVFDPPFLLDASRDLSARHKPLVVDSERVLIKGVITNSLRMRAAAA